MATTSLFSWQESSGKRAREVPQETRRPEERLRGTSRPNKIGSTESPKRIETESAKLAEMQENLRVRKRNLEFCLRGDQDSPRRPVARGRFDGQKQEPYHASEHHGGNSESRTTGTDHVERYCFEETCWMDTRLIDGGDCQLVSGSGENFARSGSKEEEAPRGDRTWILQAVPEWKRFAEWKEFGTDLVSLKVLRWNVAGQILMLTDWDVLLLQECFRKLDGVNVGAHELFTPCELMEGLRCPAVIMHQRWSGQPKAADGLIAVELDGQMTIISAHFLHKIKREFESVWRISWRQRSPSSLETHTVFRNQGQQTTGELHLAQDRWLWRPFAKFGRAPCGRSQMPRGPKCVGHGVDWCCL